jgi:hypothetical protein
MSGIETPYSFAPVFHQSSITEGERLAILAIEESSKRDIRRTLSETLGEDPSEEEVEHNFQLMIQELREKGVLRYMVKEFLRKKARGGEAAAENLEIDEENEEEEEATLQAL